VYSIMSTEKIRHLYDVQRVMIIETVTSMHVLYVVVLVTSVSSTPPWHLVTPIVDLSLSTLSRHQYGDLSQ